MTEIDPVIEASVRSIASNFVADNADVFGEIFLVADVNAGHGRVQNLVLEDLDVLSSGNVDQGVGPVRRRPSFKPQALDAVERTFDL